MSGYLKDDGCIIEGCEVSRSTLQQDESLHRFSSNKLLSFKNSYKRVHL